jgi:deoxyribodipyrimidine photolyase-like uncharacterized protein/uncharacterized protein YbjT (DUF2867 family)
MSVAGDNPLRSQPVFVTGATGYIGGRLVPRLLEAGYRVRCLARSRQKLAPRTWANDARVEVVEGDARDSEQLASVMYGCGAAYYLIHSMMAVGPAYRERDRQLALGFTDAAAQAGLRRIIYLGGLGETGANLSEHLSSRREVETVLATGPVPVTVLRAAMIIGAGSASFEILRYLVERLPIMVTPRWVSTECQPIAIRDVLQYLVACLDTPQTTGKTLDIGGPDILTYRQLMEVMAEARGLARRLVLPVPVLTPRLSSLWIHLVTPVSARIAQPLAEGLRNRVVCRDDEAARLMPQELLGVRAAIDAALGQIQAHEVETTWSDAGPIPGDPDWAGGTVFVDPRTVKIDAPPEVVYHAVCRIGGGQGYYAADWLWRLRGAMDRLAGGPGLRRGRRDPERVAYGEALDFWRVTGVEPGRRLQLRAEMKLPGEALLEFEICPLDSDPQRCRLKQTARFKPRGLLGLAYWYAVLPLHGIVFRGMLNGIRRTAEQLAGTAQPRESARTRADSPTTKPSQVATARTTASEDVNRDEETRLTAIGKGSGVERSAPKTKRTSGRLRPGDRLVELRVTGPVGQLLVVFGDQLDPRAPALRGLDKKRDAVLLMEVTEEATHVPSHKQRTVLFLSAMRHFALELARRGTRVHYVRLDDADNTQRFETEIERAVRQLRPEKLLVVRPGEWRVMTMVEGLAEHLGVPIELQEAPHFLLTPAEFDEWAQGRKEFLLEHFYRMMRRRLGILLEPDGGPIGGHWNFDRENRRPYKAKRPPPAPWRPRPDEVTQEVIALVEMRFPDAPGRVDSFGWPVTRRGARRALRDFVENRLPRFGDHQDAMIAGQPWMFHSLLSAALNLKLLDPLECVQAATQAYESGNAPINCVEGFVRQIIGWREFIRGIYWHQGPEYADRNVLDQHGALPDLYWTGETEMVCLREALGQVLEYGYGHHIQRLMVTGNFALLAGVQPRAISDWYLAMYVDAVDWVTLPNTLGMALHADGGVVGTKPYAASGRYIARMSNYCKTCRYDPGARAGESACPFTTLYWDFLLRNSARFRRNRRMAMALRNLKTIGASERRKITAQATGLRERLGIAAPGGDR